MKYRTGYKYQLAEEERVFVDIHPERTIDDEYIHLDSTGVLTIRSGYAWDGASGPTWDDKTNMRGSLYHDALYQLMREGLLPHALKSSADEVLREVCIADGMSKFRAWYWINGLSMFGRAATLAKNRKPVIEAP